MLSRMGGRSWWMGQSLIIFAKRKNIDGDSGVSVLAGLAGQHPVRRMG